MENGSPFLPDFMKERRTNATLSTGQLMCVNMTIPKAYIDELVNEAQAYLRSVKGGDHALLEVTITLKPFSKILGEMT